jgi:hypothetical protein
MLAVVDKQRADPPGPPKPSLHVADVRGHLYRQQARLEKLGWASVEFKPSSWMLCCPHQRMNQPNSPDVGRAEPAIAGSGAS